MQNLIGIKNIIKEAEGRTPKQVKRLIQYAIADNALLEELLMYVYSPNIKYYYKLEEEQFQYYKSNLYVDPNCTTIDLLEILENLRHRRYESNSQRDTAIEDFLATNNLLAFFLYKNLDIGFGVSSAKSLGILPAHNPQKGVLVADYHTDVSYPMVADVKYNGIRLTAYCEYQDVEFKLLKGNPIDIPELKEAIKQLVGVNTFALDGELIYGYGITEADRLKVASRVNEANNSKAKGTFSMQGGYKFMVYDIIPATNFHKAIPTGVPYFKRRLLLTEIIGKGSEYIGLAQQFQVQDGFEVDHLLKQIKDLNGEGLMLKHPTSTYDFKKNRQWIKCKLIREADMMIVGYTPHTKNPSWIGSLECEAIIGGKKVSVNVGSGLNDNDRDLNLFPTYMNKTVVVSYLDEVYNQGSGTYSVSSSRFVKPSASTPLQSMLREDKLFPVNY